MEKLQQLYEGKAKKVYATADPNLYIVSYKDDATAFNGLKKGTIAGKGVINNRMSNMMMQMLEKEGVPTHFVRELSDRDTLVKKVSIVPLEVIIRNLSAGSFAKHYGVEEGIVFDAPTIEFSYKNDELGDPLLNRYHALALKLATKEEINTIERYAFKINEVMKAYFLKLNITLVDFKLEFGRLPDGTIVLAQAAKVAIKAINPDIKVGLTLSLHDLQWEEGGEEFARKEWDEEFAHYLPYIKDDDFLGVQNYTRTLYGKEGQLPNHEGAILTQMDYEFYPEALEHVIRKVHEEFKGDLYVTENGVAVSDDSLRCDFIERALSGVENCLKDGIPVKGYFHWSLLDNFEWQKGFSMTFGLVAVNRETMDRKPKQSLSLLGSYTK